MIAPETIMAVGNEVAIKWADGIETFYPMDFLREYSPSAENRGEVDLLGRKWGGSEGCDYRGVTVTGWDQIGDYALQFRFSDGHNTGLYTYDFLRRLTHILDQG
jgi:DUF971 family protein